MIPQVDEETHKAMLSYYYKKQEEQKALKNDEDDSYLTSEWANPKALKGESHSSSCCLYHV